MNLEPHFTGHYIEDSLDLRSPHLQMGISLCQLCSSRPAALQPTSLDFVSRAGRPSPVNQPLQGPCSIYDDRFANAERSSKHRPFADERVCFVSPAHEQFVHRNCDGNATTTNNRQTTTHQGEKIIISMIWQICSNFRQMLRIPRSTPD